MSLHYNDGNSYSLVNGKKIFKFKAKSKNVNFLTQFSLGSISNKFSVTESREISLNGNVYDFSVNYSSIDKSDILNIHKYLMNKSNKITISLIKQVFIVLLSFSISLATKYLYLNDEISMVRPNLIDLNLVEHKNYLFISNLDKFN